MPNAIDSTPFRASCSTTCSTLLRGQAVRPCPDAESAVFCYTLVSRHLVFWWIDIALLCALWTCPCHDPSLGLNTTVPWSWLAVAVRFSMSNSGALDPRMPVAVNVSGDCGSEVCRGFPTFVVFLCHHAVFYLFVSNNCDLKFLGLHIPVMIAPLPRERRPTLSTDSQDNFSVQQQLQHSG